MLGHPRAAKAAWQPDRRLCRARRDRRRRHRCRLCRGRRRHQTSAINISPADSPMSWSSAARKSMANAPMRTVTRALATATDWQLEGSRGESFISLNATLMRAYMERHGVAPEAFGPFAINAHRNAPRQSECPAAQGRGPAALSRLARGRRARRLFDVSPICNGAAAVVLANGEVARSPERANRPRVQAVASLVHRCSRAQPPRRSAASHGGGKFHPRCVKQAGIGHGQVDSSSCTMLTPSCRCSAWRRPDLPRPAPARGWRLEKQIAAGGDLPLSTMGGLKARGHPVGAPASTRLSSPDSQLDRHCGRQPVARTRTRPARRTSVAFASTVVHARTCGARPETRLPARLAGDPQFVNGCQVTLSPVPGQSPGGSLHVGSPH